MRSFVTALLLFAASTANAVNWQPIGKPDPNGGVLYLDVAGITQVKTFRRAWFKAVYPSDQPIPAEFLATVPKDNPTFRSEKSLRYFDCLNRTSAVMRYYWDHDDGKFAGYHYEENLTFREAPRETRDALMLETVCNFAGELAEPEAAGVRAPRFTAKIKRAARPGDYYPELSRRHGEQGAPIVKACVGPDGALLRDPEITKSSGFPELDGAAILVAKFTRYAAATNNGSAVPESCIDFKIKFTLDDK